MRTFLIALALLGLSLAAGERVHAAPARPHRAVAGSRPADAAATTVAHNFAVPHPLPFLRGIRDNHDLAARIRANLKAHPDGTAKLDPARCKRDSSCATPTSFLQSAKNDRPDITLATLADYIDSLQAHVLTAEEARQQWDMDCLDRDHDYQVVIGCGNRKFHAGEVAYVDPKTHKFELAKDCANWVRGIHHEPAPVIVQPHCAEIDYETREGDSDVRIFVMGPPVTDRTCQPAIRPAGEDDYLPGWFDECANLWCDGTAIMMATGMPIERRASYWTTTPGIHRIRVPLSFTRPDSPNRVVLCLDRDGAHSDGMLILPTSFRKVGALPVATLYYSRDEVPPGAPRIYWPWGEWYGR